MRTIPLLLLLFAAAVLAACATPAQQAEQAEREMDTMIKIYGPACVKLGYQNNSDPWRDCILRLNAKDALARYQFSSGFAPGYPGWRYGF